MTFTSVSASTVSKSTNSTFNMDLINSLIEKKTKNFDTILIISYSLIVILSLVGNCIVCKVMLEKRHSLNTTNILIFNLAISDLMMTTINIPFNIARFVLTNWPFGGLLCMAVPFTQSLTVHASSITMMFIAIERYKCIINNSQLSPRCFAPFRPYVRILVIIWLLATVFSIPHGIYNRIINKKSINLIRCRVIYPEPSEQFRQRLTLFTFFSQYLIPVVTTVICYVRICLFLWHRRTVRTVSECQRISMHRRKKRRIKMLIIVVIAFAVCWLPLNCYHIMTDFKVINYKSVLFFTTHWLAMSSVCYNPFIYCWLNEEFRRKVKNIFNCFVNSFRFRANEERAENI